MECSISFKCTLLSVHRGKYTLNPITCFTHPPHTPKRPKDAPISLIDQEIPKVWEPGTLDKDQIYMGNLNNPNIYFLEITILLDCIGKSMRNLGFKGYKTNIN